MSENNDFDRVHGAISWNELMAPDTQKATEFYTELFGWKKEDNDMGGMTYSMFSVGDRPVAGMLATPPEAAGAPAIWMQYVTVSDIRQAVAKAQSLGANLLKDVTDIQMGSFAVVQDPQGAIFGLWQHAS